MPVNKLLQSALIAAALVWGGCSASGEKTGFRYMKLDESTVLVKDVVHVSTTPLERGMFPTVVEMPGRIAIPDKDLYVISSRVQGRLESLTVTVGDSVAKRQPLATVWSPDLATAVEELKLAISQDDKDLARLSREKLSSLGLDPDDVSAGGTTFPIRSPVGGVVLERRLNAGASMQPGDVVMVVGKLGAYQFQGDLTPDQALKVRPGMRVTFDDEPTLTAEVSSVSPVADPSSRLIKVRCAFGSELPRRLPQETFLKAGVVVSVREALLVPAKALILTGKGNFMFVREPGKDRDGARAFRRVPVEVQSRNKTVAALSPAPALSEGLQAVSEGGLLLNELVEQ